MAAGPTSPHGLKAREVLLDGEWHPYEEVRAAVMRVIPPGMAIRKAESERLAEARKRSKRGRPPLTQERTVSRSSDFLIEYGRSRIANDVLKAEPYEVRTEQDGSRFIRRAARAS